MENTLKVLAVDDEAVNIKIIESVLEKYEVKTADSAINCFSILENWTPDIVLLDVLMPDEDGLTVCKKIRENEDTKDIPVIFVSALAYPEDRLAGYEAGGDDYVAKPFEIDELMKKIDLSITKRQQLLSSQEQSAYAMQTAMTAMTNASEIGQVLQFYQDSLFITEYDVLAKALVNAVSAYGLHSITKFAIAGNYEYSSRGVILPMESAVFDQLKFQNKIFQFKSRCMFNGEHVSLFVLEMPMDDEEKCGRLKDHLIMLVDAVNARIASLMLEKDRQKKGEELARFIKNTTQVLSKSQSIKVEQAIKQNNVVNDLSEHIESLFSSMGLDEEQEITLHNFISNAQKELSQLAFEDAEQTKKLQSIVDDMKEMV